jgi:mono/diheme cytochrome c family protein
MRKTIFLPIVLLGMGLMAVSATSCDHDRNKPGYSFYPDMENSQAYDTYSANPVFKDGKTNQAPAANTVPRGHIPYRFQKNDSSLLTAGKELRNPYAGDETVLKEGKRLYGIYCAICHGDTGDGKGSLYTSGKYTYPPASLLSDKAMVRPDGEVFHIISIGYGIMGAHQSQILPDERWQIIEYIKTGLQTKR